MRRAQGLLIAGLVTAFAAIGIIVFLILIRPDSDRPMWAVGLVPLSAGAALMISGWLVWPRNGYGERGTKS